MNEQEVRTLLADLAETPAPPSRVVVPRPVRRRRRYVHSRTWLSAAAAAVVVALLAVGAYVVTGGSPTSTDPAAAAPERFDPLMRYASFGWVPDEARMNSRSTVVNDVRFAMDVSEYVPDPSKGPMAAKPAASVGVALYAVGVKPESEQPPDIRGATDHDPGVPYLISEAPPVDGKRAEWLTVPGDSEFLMLRWHYAPGAWAEVSVARLSGDLHESAHRVATELRLDTERLRFPFHLTDLSAELRPVASSFREGGLDGPWRADLTFHSADDGVEMRVAASPMQPSNRNPNTTVDGHEAHHEKVTDQQYAEGLFVYDVTGLQADVTVLASDAADAAPVGPDGALGVYRGLTVHSDRSEWTDRPLR
jgi:hypothetical protein